MAFAREGAKSPVSPRQDHFPEDMQKTSTDSKENSKRISKHSEHGVYATHSDIWFNLKKEISLFRN